MNLQSGLKLLLASAVAVCCALPADAQSVVTEVVGNVQSFHGGWTGNGSQIGQPITFDFAYDASMITTKDTNTTETASAPITSADIVGGIFGTGINLERDGSGTGKITDKINFNTGVITIDAQTSTHAPSAGFTGDVYGFNLDFNGTTTSVDLTRDVYSHGHLDRDDSGTVDLGNVSIGQGQVQAPEIDPTSALSALTLLMGGLAVIRGRQSIKLQSA
jgi:opacity protein-like surface antigen